ncbi:hypothetical protein ACHAQJ_000180 [Trichoderma viride]
MIMTETTEDDWVVVKSRKGGRFRPAPKVEDMAAFEPGFKATDPLPYLTKEEIAGKHFYIRAQFERTKECAELLSIIAEFVKDNFKTSGEVVVTAVCLGIGSFDPPDGNWVIAHKAHNQLVAFLIIVEYIERQTRHRIKCIFQEPEFEPSDVEFLESLGHEVVETPAAFEAVDSQTLLFGCHLYRGVYSLALQGELPALFVGTGWEIWSDIAYCWEPEDCNIDAIETMEKTHKKFAFPEAKGGNVFRGTSIYFG